MQKIEVEIQKKNSGSAHFRSTGERPGHCWEAGSTAGDGSSNIRGIQDEDCEAEDTYCTLGPNALYLANLINLVNFYDCLEENQICTSGDQAKKAGEGELQSKTACREKKWRCAKSVKKSECENIVCTARDGLWAGQEICLERKYRCDNFLQCEDGSDEEGCEETYRSKNIFTKDHLFTCKSPFLTIKSKQNKTGRFFPMRGVWYCKVFIK